MRAAGGGWGGGPGLWALWARVRSASWAPGAGRPGSWAPGAGPAARWPGWCVAVCAVAVRGLPVRGGCRRGAAGEAGRGAGAGRALSGAGWVCGASDVAGAGAARSVRGVRGSGVVLGSAVSSSFDGG
ncbi:hypothetical protein GCM10020256_63190 [Streptomyces thermocoprophilus]